MRGFHKHFFLPLTLLAGFVPQFARCADHGKKSAVAFQTSDRCMVCHNGLTTSTGEDVSIGFHWRASVMANSSRDPYWQASSRRETIDHPESQAFIEDDCSVCHMPVTRYEAKLHGKRGTIFAHLPFDPDHESGRQAEDGVTCSVCHQIGKQKLGTPESFNGGFVINPPDPEAQHPEYGPFDIKLGQQRIMRTSSGGFLPDKEDHIRKSELCATCHTLYTKALGANGAQIGVLPEQVPYQEWLHSDYRDKRSCQECHMPEVKEAVPIAKVLGVPRQGLHQHTFVAANFLLQNMLNRYRDDLSVEALAGGIDVGRPRHYRVPASEGRAYRNRFANGKRGPASGGRFCRKLGRTQISDRVSIAPCLAALHSERPRPSNGIRVGRLEPRRIDSRQR